MADPIEFDDQGPLIPEPPSRVRRILTVAVLLTLIASMVFLAWVSGRGEIRIRPDDRPRPTAQPATATTASSRLAIVDAGGHLATTDAIGGSVVSFGGSDVTFAFPTWSPDGTRIATVGKTADDTGIYVFTAHAEGAAAIDPLVIYRSADRPPFYLYWAPDGRAITFLTTEPDGLALRVAPTDASAPATIVRKGSPMYWAWADATRMLIHSGGGGLDGFFGEVGLDGLSVEPSVLESGEFRAPAVTGDGRFRAYVAPGDGPPGQVVVESRDRSSHHEIDVFGAAAIDFGPATDELAFIAPAAPGGELTVPVGPLRVVDAGSGSVRTVLAGSVVAFFWAPDGRTIAALQVVAPGDDNVASAGNSVLTSAGNAGLTSAALLRGRPQTGVVAAPGLGLRLVFVNVQSGAIRSQRPVQVSDTFTAQLLPYFDQHALSHRLWSSDGASFVLPIAAEDGTSELVVIQADGSDARRVADGVAGFWSP